MVIDFDLEEIIFYLNATEPTGKYCNNIENLKNKLLKAEKLEKAIDILKEYFEIQIVETDSKEMATICISRKDCKTMLHFAQTIIRDKEKINTLKEVLE